MANLHIRVNAIKFAQMEPMQIRLLLYVYKLALIIITQRIKLVIHHAQMDLQIILLNNALMFVLQIITLNCQRGNVFKIVNHILNILQTKLVFLIAQLVQISH